MGLTFGQKPMTGQDEIAVEVVEALKITLSGNLKTTKSSAKNDEVYNLYLQGRYFFELVTADGNRKSLECFKRTIEMDSAFAPAWASYSVAQWRACGGNASCSNWEELKANNRRALELDPNLAEGYVNRSLYHRSEYNWVETMEDIKKAYSLDSKNSRVLRNYGQYLVVNGRFDEGIAMCNSAMMIDPVQPNSFRYLGRAYYYANRMDEAYAAYLKAYELSPMTVPIIGILEFFNVLVAVKGPDALLRISDSEQNEAIKLACTSIGQFMKHQQVEADKNLATLVEKYSTQNAYEIAQVYSYRNDKINVFKFLELAFDQKELNFSALNVDPVFKSFRSEPRFKVISKKIKYPE